MYLEWCRQMSERWFGFRRFQNRMMSLPGVVREGAGNSVAWRGLDRATGAGMLGTMVPDRVYAD